VRALLPDPSRPVGDDAELEAVYASPPTASVRANFVVCLDGAIETGGRSAGLGGPDDRRIFTTLRALADVILVGAGTAREEHYGPAKVEAAAGERREARGQRPVPTIAVVTGGADLDPDSKLFSRHGGDGPTPPRPVVLTCLAASEEQRARLADVADVVVCGDGDVDHATVLDALRQRGLAQILCEGGPSLATALAAADLLDELCLTHTPLLAGPGRRSLSMGDEWSEPKRWALASLLEGDGMLFARYRTDR
jgi:riboflavin biosynthesis pyrimidine reductase